MVDFEKDIEQSVRVLKDGGLILYPTDTVWGVGCDATNEEAVNKIYQLKKRTDKKAMIVLVAEEREVLQYVASPDLQVFAYLQEAKKPTTVIYEGAIGLADNLVAEDGSIAIRICEEEFCKHLIKRFRKPVVSTSANISGHPVASVFMEITDVIKNGVDYVVHHRQDDKNKANPSTIIKWTNGTVEVLRS